MDDKQNELDILKSLLYEFFTQPISHERRREIELSLASWQQQDLVWKKSIDFLSHCNDHYVAMYCLTAIETVISKKWLGLDWQEKRVIKEFLHNYSMQSSLPPSVIEKTVKLVVDTARHDWPHFFPDFFVNIMTLLRSENTGRLGLVYLRTASQELAVPRQDLSTARSTELQKLLLSQMQDVFSTMLDMLSSGQADDILILSVLNNLFTWVPAEQIPQHLVTVIFRIALETQSPDRALIALSTLNEMLYRRWTPPCWQQFLQFIVTFLQTPSQNIDRRYLEKMSDLLRLVLSSHMSRGADSMNELLAATIQWTERQETLHPGITSCMQVWHRVLDHPSANKYGDKLVQLASLVMLLIQRTRNSHLTVEDDDSDLAEEDEEEEEDSWQSAIRPCLEVVARIAEIQPEEVLKPVVTQWVEFCQATSSPSTDPQFEALLCDVATFTRAVARLSPIWSERNGSNFVRGVIIHLLSLARLQYHSTTDAVNIALLSIHCEALAALKACCYWLPALPEPELKECCREILTIVVESLTPTSSRKLQHSAAHLLSSLTAAVRIPDMWELAPLRPLFDLPLTHLLKEDGFLVAGGLLSSLILPNCKPEANDERLEVAGRLIERLTASLSQLSANCTAQIATLHLLIYLVRVYESEGSKQKKLLCAIFQNSAERALSLYQVSNNAAFSQEILHFFQTLLECLQTQVGVSFVKSVVQVLICSFSSDKLQRALESEDGGGLAQLLGILDLVVRTPALAAAQLTPLTVGLSLELAPRVIADSTSTAVQEAYFCLVYSIVEHKWQYLVKGCTDSEQRAEEFLGLVRAMARALLLTDINLFRLNLAHLEKLNQRWKLYRTTFFKKDLLGELVSVLFTTLLNKSHNLLADDIAACLCHLISADPETFFSQCLPHYLTSAENIDSNQRETLMRNFSKDLDFPTLTKSIFRLINDLSCYQTYNAGLPSKVGLG